VEDSERRNYKYLKIFKICMCGSTSDMLPMSIYSYLHYKIYYTIQIEFLENIINYYTCILLKCRRNEESIKGTRILKGH